MNSVAPLRAGRALNPIYPQSIEDVYRLATMAYKSGMLKPATVWSDEERKKVEEAPEATLSRGTMIIMQGMEIGVPPMQAVQLLAMINGRITAHSEAVPGLLLAHGIKIREWWTGEEMSDDWACHIELTRPGGDKHVSSFSVKDAKRARLWDTRETVTKTGKNDKKYDVPNDSPWFKYPKRMLRARALGFAGKDFGADALKGIQIREEAEDMLRIEDARDVTPAPAAIPDLPDFDDTPPKADAIDEPATQENAIVDIDALHAAIDMALATCKDTETLAEVWNQNEIDVEGLDRSSRQRFYDLYSQHEKRIEAV
jgi:hypothetical protein